VSHGATAKVLGIALSTSISPTFDQTGKKNAIIDA